MLKSGFTVNAQRKDNRGQLIWQEVDITDLSDEEFVNYWISIKDDRDKFMVCNTLRKLSQTLSDFGDDIPS